MFDRQAFEEALLVVQYRTRKHLQHPPEPIQLQAFESVASTNQTLWSQLNQLDPSAVSGKAVLAAQQGAGRGQWGRQWSSLPGGLYLSVALMPQLPIAHAAQLTFASAWGIAIALQGFGVPVQLKWPNDLVLEGHKLGGILTETRLSQDVITQAVVGVGLNWQNPVPETGINLQRFFAQQSDREATISSLEMLAAIAAQGIVSGYHTHALKGMETLLPAYQALLLNLGETVQVDGQSATVTGVAATGELRLRPLPPEGEAVSPSTNHLTDIYLQPGTISLGYRRSPQ